VITPLRHLSALRRPEYSIGRRISREFRGHANNKFRLSGNLERLEVADVNHRADLYWEWGTSLWRRTSELDLMACKAHVARPVMVTASGHADLEGVY
jgi:hypothetical protein